MTQTHVIEFESVALLTVAAFAGFIFAFSSNHQIKQKTVFNLPVVAALTPTPSPEPTSAQTTFSQISPDGKKKVSMAVTKHSSTSTSYAFTISDSNGSNSQPLYSVNLPNGEYMSIPFNTFSPDDKYLFLEHITKNGTDAYAFRVDGTSLGEASQYDNITEIYNAKKTGNTYTTTTGWASDTLLIVDTKTPNDIVQSYWVELPSKAVIPLATQF